MARSSSFWSMPSSTSPTPGSTRGYGPHDRRAAAGGAGPQGVLSHRGRARPGGRRRVVVALAGRDAGHRWGVRVREERDDDVGDAADHRPERALRGRGALQGPRPDETGPGPDPRGARGRHRDDLPGPDDLAQPGVPGGLADRGADQGTR